MYIWYVGLRGVKTYTHGFNILCEVEGIPSEGWAEVWSELEIVTDGEEQEEMARVF